MSKEIARKFHTAQDHANYGQNTEFLKICDEIYSDSSITPDILYRLGSLYIAYGFPSKAKNCFTRLLNNHQDSIGPLINLAHSELLLGNINQCQAIFNQLLRDHPDNLNVLQHTIFFSEYFPNISNQHRVFLAKTWGQLATQKAKGPLQKPSKINPSPIRIGYVSGDFCQHTVGLLIKNVIARHDRNRFTIYAFSSGSVEDWVTEEIKSHSNFIDIRLLDDQQLVELIKKCGIDILVDLSGHTGGSRLSAFAYRPAPIQLSWLGYYATTGLGCIDGVILDRWHISQATESLFVEPLIQMPQGRWCYLPTFPAPTAGPPPVIKNGLITFGSFNNTLKYNPAVFECWSQILRCTPQSKLILKWRTFNDPGYCEFVLNQFAQYGIDSSRIELRGPSFHLKMLEEYQDIDIALDPFPFSGGMTSCEALYMGVPVITMPQDQTVSRQTAAFLHAIQRPNWIAEDLGDYIDIAIRLALNHEQLSLERNVLRDEMIKSPLMNIHSFTQSLEQVYINLMND